MIKNNIFILSLCIVCFYNIQITHAQKLDSTSTLAVVPFKMGFENSKDDNDYSEIIAERVLAAIEQSKRFKLIDRTSFESIRKELDFQNGDFKDEFVKWGPEEMARFGKRLRANYILTGNISNVDATTHLITGAYTGVIGFTIKVIDVNTGEVPISEVFEITSGKGKAVTKIVHSRGEAISRAFANMNEPIKKFIDKFFPIYAKYLRTEEVNKKGEMGKVLINKGSNQGFRVDQELVIEIQDNDSDNKLPPVEAGKAEVIDVQPAYSIVKIITTKKNLENMTNKEKVLYFRSKSN